MKKLKIFFSFLLSVIFFSSVIVYGDNIIKTIQVAYRNLSIQVNGKIIQSEQEPFIYEGRTFAPLRTIAEAVNKNVEWDNEKNQVNITDKEPASLCFPIHKIGERVEKFPFALAITKIYTGKKDKHGTSFIFPEELLFVDLIIENESTQYKYFQGMRPFSIWDDKGNLLAILNENYLNSLVFPSNSVSDKSGYLWCKIDENIKNKRLILIFYPIDSIKPDIAEEANVFIAIDIGKIE